MHGPVSPQQTRKKSFQVNTAFRIACGFSKFLMLRGSIRTRINSGKTEKVCTIFLKGRGQKDQTALRPENVRYTQQLFSVAENSGFLAIVYPQHYSLLC